MKAPESLETLIDYGIIQEVVRPLMSGKEAQVYVVLAGGEPCVAKVYKEANRRTFKHRSEYTEGRRTRNTRDQRAMNKRSQHGRKKDEDAWRSAEVEMIYRLRDAGVRVPEPLNFVEGVLIMELVTNASGDPAPRLGDLTYSPAEALEIYHQLIREVVRMLCAGVVHGDLSEFNVLMSDQGPVVIDFPQSVDPTKNPNGKKLLLRDVENLHRFLARFAPDEPLRPYGEEIWSLYEANRLRPDTKLSGRYSAPKGKVDTGEVMALIEDASRENRARRAQRDGDNEEASDGARSQAAPDATASPRRRVVDFSAERARPTSAKKGARKARGARPARRRRASSEERVPPAGPARKRDGEAGATPEPRRRRRGGQRAPGPEEEGAARNESQAADSDRPAGPQKRRRTRSRTRSRTRGGRGDEGQGSGRGSESAKRSPAARRETGDRSGEPSRQGRPERKAGEKGSGTKRSTGQPSSPAGHRERREQGEGDRPRKRRGRRPRKGGSRP